MSELFASNCPVSWPAKIPGLIPDVDFGGAMFSYDWGLCFDPGTDEPDTMRRPAL